MKNKYAALEKEYQDTIMRLSETTGWPAEQAESVVELVVRAAEKKAHAVTEKKYQDMVKQVLGKTAAQRVKGLLGLRDCVQKLIDQQLDGFISDGSIRETQAELDRLYYFPAER